MLLVYFFVSGVTDSQKKSFFWFNTARDESRPLTTLPLAWPLCGLKSSLQSLRNSWGRLVASLREWVNCNWHFGHRFSESKSLCHWSWQSGCTNASHCQQLLIPDYTYLDNNIPPAHKMTSDVWLQSFTVLMRWYQVNLREKGSNNSQQCCVRLHEAKSLTGFKLCATTRTTSDNMQQGVQTDAICNIQQCREMLANNVASVCQVISVTLP